MKPTKIIFFGALLILILGFLFLLYEINMNPINGWAPNGTHSGITVYNSQMTGDHWGQGDSAQKFNIVGIHEGYIEIEKTLATMINRSTQAEFFVIRIKPTELTPISSVVGLELYFYVKKNSDPWSQVGGYFISRASLNSWGLGLWVVPQNFPQQFNKLKIKFVTIYPPGGQNINASVILDWYITSSNGGATWEAIIDDFERTLVGMEPQNETVKEFKLKQNYPNPFNPLTNIEFWIQKPELVTLTVYDALGKEIEVLVNEEMEAGSYKIAWNANKFSSGTYLYRLTAGDYTDTKKMILIR